ncbi:NAD(P)-binding protein [Paraphaeosphaeria sporulosa]|uniref:NAD(P)-binding protein n=1 Tax=Paraphaeosphaeria sporulosa TaxID=1460663 RepID=A0A177BZC5_9PLEO|nr:NAD(P)-binding protein [Paraphaeosphaeria sporulosa]OAG00884.1 NAD(P)-binding protein [Paraphaeosphaeria sporulosa]
MAINKTITLITGANGGIGFELAAQLLGDASKHVLLGSRSFEKGEAAVKELQTRNLPGSVELVQIDVTNEDSINAAVKEVEVKHGRLDALVNNAAIADAPGTSFRKLNEVFRTNVAGPYATVEAFAPLLEKSTRTPRIVNVSSGGGSIGLRLDPSNAFYTLKGDQYRVSKAGLNMVNACQAVEYGPKGWKVFSFCPGFTVSNLGPHNKVENGAKPTSEGAGPMVGILNGERDSEHGLLLKADGQWPW